MINTPCGNTSFPWISNCELQQIGTSDQYLKIHQIKEKIQFFQTGS